MTPCLSQICPLCCLHCSAKDLDEDSYASWASRYKAACASSSNRASKVASVCEELETGLSLLGATAVEDKLQVGGGGGVRLWGWVGWVVRGCGGAGSGGGLEPAGDHCSVGQAADGAGVGGGGHDGLRGGEVCVWGGMLGWGGGGEGGFEVGEVV
jgi:hypothetical protein